MRGRLRGTLEGQMIAVLAISLLLLLAAVTILNLVGRYTPIEWAESDATLYRLKRLRTVLESVEPARRTALLQAISQCHDGYTLTGQPFARLGTNARTDALARRLAEQFAVGQTDVSVGFAQLTRADFSYGACNESEIGLPMRAIVVSTRLDTGQWLNAEVHPHEWHLEALLRPIMQYGAVGILVGALSILLVHQLSKPLNNLTHAARRFGEGLQVSPVAEAGPADLRQAIQAFNAMQRQVADEVSERTNTLAAISHDLRTPLTGLRIKAELVEDAATRRSLVASLDKLDRMTASALGFLRGESRSEPVRTVDLGALLASECSDFEEAGQHAEYIGTTRVHYACRPDALARAVRNLIENAIKYGNGAAVDLRSGAEGIEISIADSGPGIPEEQFGLALEPFRRLSNAREGQQGGFGLGLAVARAVARGHGGELVLRANDPSGLIATIRLPAVQRRTTTLPT